MLFLGFKICLVKHEVVAKYDATASGYEELYEEEQKAKYELIASKVKPHSSFKLVLDLGCGTGLFFKWLKGFSEEVIGVDVSKKMITQAKEKGLQVILADAESLPFKREVFDAVFAITVLQLTSNVFKAFSEVFRVLKEGGLFVYTLIKAKEDLQFFLNTALSAGFVNTSVVNEHGVKDVVVFANKVKAFSQKLN